MTRHVTEPCSPLQSAYVPMHELCVKLLCVRTAQHAMGSALFSVNSDASSLLAHAYMCQRPVFNADLACPARMIFEFINIRVDIIS